MEGVFNETPDDNLPDNIHPDHVLWHTNKLAEWLKFSGTSMATTEIQRSVMREAAKRLCHMADNPRNTEQDVIRVFVKLAEMLDEYCMGGTQPKHTLEDIRHAANDTANQARALLDMFPKQKDCSRIAALEAQLAEALKYGARDNAEALSCVKHLLCKKHNQYWTTISGACMACRAVDAESQLAAANEAVRVLGKEVVDCMDMGQLTVRHLNPETIDNPIASAAITDAAKAREG